METVAKKLILQRVRNSVSLIVSSLVKITPELQTETQ